MSYHGLADVFKGKAGLNITTTNIDVDIEGVRLSGFLAQPVTPGKYPGIVMIHEWWGLNDQIKSMADIMAREGYVVLAVDLFQGNVATTIEGARANIQNNPNNETIPKMQAAVKYLRNMTNVNKRKIASLGWCYGGGQSFQLGVNDDLQATVIYYGQVSTDKAILSNMKQPVLGLFGVEDASIPVKDVREFERILKEQGTDVNISIYERAGHGFSNPTNTQAFRNEQAIDAWNRTLGFLELAFNGTDFNIIFRYGFGAKNKLDTFKGTYTWDMVFDPSITVNLSLSNREKERIHQKMIENNFFDYPDSFPERRDRIITPSMEFSIKVESDSKIKEVSWDANSLFEDENIEKRLQEITRTILEIIESKDEYKKLPTPRGVYV